MTKTPKTPAEGTLETMPVLPLRDIVVFPHMIVPLFVGREKSIKALEEVMREDKRILLVAQKNPADDDPAIDAIYEVGTLAQVLQLLKLPDGTVKVLVEGFERARVHGFSDRTEFFEAEVEVLPIRLGTRRRDRGAGAHRGRPVRQLCEAEQEGAAGGAGVALARSPTMPSWPTPSPRISPSRSPRSRSFSR